MFTRQDLIEHSLESIVARTGSQGQTPQQTLSRVLQELRDAGRLRFLGSGKYLLLDDPLDVIAEDYPDDAIDAAIMQSKVLMPDVLVHDITAQARQRRGVQRLRNLTLIQYDTCCAVCDVRVEQLLVASHIARWADNVEGRGRLSNVICFCRFHDALFENGYFSLTDSYNILTKPKVASSTIRSLLDLMHSFRYPHSHTPAPDFLKEHRMRCGFGK